MEEEYNSKNSGKKEEWNVKRINSTDIARLAGVSRSTVSRVINGYDNVPPETYNKVMAVIKENHYYPQLSGQLLSGKSTHTIGLFWIDPNDIARDTLVQSFFTNIIDAAASRGYMVLSCRICSLEDGKARDDIMRIFLEGRIDAGIFVGMDNNEPLIDQLVALKQIVGVFDHFREDAKEFNRIGVNFDRSCGERAIDYLYNLGHRRIAVIDGDMSRASCVHRHESYMRGLTKHGLPIRNQWLSYGGIVAQGGYEAAKKMLSGCKGDLPTAVCANNDSVALGVYQACEELGIRIPEDLSVIGNDGHRNGIYAHPPLTTFTFDFRDMFFSLVNRVIDTFEGKKNVPQFDFIPGTFVERSSCRSI